MKNFADRLLSKQEKLSLIGLGYVGLPIAVAFDEKVSVIGFDINEEKIQLYKSGIDPTKEVGDDVLAQCNIEFSSDPEKLREARFHIVAVPTPVDEDKTPYLRYLEDASYLLGKNLVVGSIVVYESTVYPGATEEMCIPILEQESGLKCGVDFSVGYSPERINPGDNVHKLSNIVKVVSGYDATTLEEIADVYELVVKAGVYRAENIKVAEAAKVIENSQRDINIAFMNELSIIFNKMGIDTQSVLKAAKTKWNFLDFAPGLVGGHCIGVDPYYITHKAQRMGYHSQVILAGRKINDDMGKYVAENVVKCLVKADIPVKKARIAVLGFTFKENCPDVRNTRVIDIINELKEYDIEPVIFDPIGDVNEARLEYGVHFSDITELCDMDAVVVAVAHQCFKSIDVDEMYSGQQTKVLVDVKGVFDKTDLLNRGYIYWRL